MTTFERFQLLSHAIQNLEGLRKDMRRNAQAYATQAQSATLTVAQITSIVSQDATQYQIRLAWVANIPDDIRAEMASWLPTIGMDASELVSAYQELKAAADAQQNAALTTYAQIINGATAILNMIPAHYSLWA
jgi:hypothetical protein